MSKIQTIYSIILSCNYVNVNTILVINHKKTKLNYKKAHLKRQTVTFRSPSIKKEPRRTPSKSSRSIKNAPLSKYFHHGLPLVMSFALFTACQTCLSGYSEVTSASADTAISIPSGIPTFVSAFWDASKGSSYSFSSSSPQRDSHSLCSPSIFMAAISFAIL